MNEKYDIIIGMEIHAELKTKSKMFCACDNNAQDKEPNTTVCPICMGHPGALPFANKQAIEWTILTGLALHCTVNRLCKFDRKNYFYPDLPKGYQVSQYDLPLVYKGYLEINGEKILITRIHLEEDTGKLIHPNGKNYSLVDYNRSSTPLMELVTEPVIKNASTAKKFCQAYQQLLRYLEISNADMEKGEMRCEANVSIQEKGKWEYADGLIKPLGDYELNPKVELKNINSFRSIEKAIEYEIKRQITAINEREKLIQETRGWSDTKNVTVRQRVKETSADYRYFPEPDIPPLQISEEWIGKLNSLLPELPWNKKQRFMDEYFMENSDADIMTSDKAFAGYGEQVISELYEWIESTGDDWERQKRQLSKTAVNWLLHELLKHLNNAKETIKDIKITSENFAELVCLVYQQKINSSAAQTILEHMYQKGGDPTNIMADFGLEQIDDNIELERIISDEILSKNEAQVTQYKAGKENVLQFLVGKTMAVTKGKANPKIVTELLKKLLK